MLNRPAHLSDEQLARLQDGEASQRDSKHLASCEECAVRLRDLQTVTAAYLDYAIRIPQPPQPWRSLSALIAEHAEHRSAKPFRWWPRAAALAAALCAGVLLALLFRTSHNPSVHATELLTQSASVSLPRDRFISMHMRGRALIRPAVLVADGNEPEDAEATHLRTLFSTAHYGWDEPLSARSFLTWRGRLRRKKDSVTIVRRAGAEPAYRVRTDAPGEVLRSAALTLTGPDLRPTSGSFDFEGDGLLQIAEASAPRADTQPLPSGTAHETPAEIPAGPADTLHVLAELDRIGAGVGEPIEITEDPHHRSVVVRASGLSKDRQQQIELALKPLPRVALEFSTSSAPSSGLRPNSTEQLSTRIPAPLRQQWEERIGGAAALQDLTDRVLDASSSAVARAHALEVLARKFPPDIAATLNTPDQQLLDTLRHKHVTELTRNLAQIRTELKPILATSDNLPHVRTGATAWQTTTAAVVTSAQAVDGTLNRLLAGSYSQPAGEEMLHALAAQLDALGQAIEDQRVAGR